MQTGSIYLIKNLINEKIYVGMTTCPINKRFKQHEYKSKRNSRCPVHLAISKYGINSFSIALLENCLLNILGEREIYWIKKLNSMNIGYNLTKGGNGSRYHTNEIKEKISKSLLGHKLSEQTKEKISCSLRNKKLTPEHRKNISNALNKNDVVLKRSLAMLGKIHKKQTKEKISIAIKKLWQNEFFKNKSIEARTGINNSRSVLVEENVLEIKSAWKKELPNKRGLTFGTKGEFYKRFAMKFNVTPPAICHIIKGKSWKHLGEI